ncbi:tetratricopeptide repeat protein [Azospirillum cavernae]|uniref:Tetratricopeptide repeat protein n=1 Tax=Azospirillum cavernae TaxID=2320860 RepID=A0A418VW14_9PROT|nr:tetratricopeptide repeat protein [Azospirillum cavernae]
MGQLACKLEVGERAGAALPDVRSMLASAVARHKAGDAAAGDLYRAILSAEPSHGDVLHLLGVTALQAGTAEVASGWLRRALVIDRAQAYYRNSLGEALRALGRPNEAREQYRLALTLSPAYPESLANLLRQPQPGDNASALLERFCRLRLASASEILAVADSRLLSGRLADANLAYRAAVALEPATVQAYVNLGATASREKHYAQAATAFRRALRLSPDHPGAWNNLASAVWELNDGQGAVRFCRRSVALKPDHPDPYANLGYVQRSQAQNGDDFAEAATLCRRALQINPSHVSALNNLGIVNLDLGHLDEAERLFRRTLDAEPKHPDARFNLSLALLKAGRFKEGWGFYEARWETGQLPMVNAQLRAWQGEPLNGATILLHAEQGHGDTLHFVRYAPLVAALGGRVVLAVQPALKRLVAGMPGVAAVHALTDAFPAPDFHCPLMSLPRLLGTELGTIPSGIPYLFPPAEAIGKWLGQPLPGAGLRVGLVWSGDPRPGLLRANLTDRRRSMTLRDLAPLAGVPNLRFVNLQMGGAAAQLADPPTGMDIHDPMGAVTDFADTAALVLRLDLVITVDTSVAHLVGALGKPVWVLSRYDGCWRWLQDRDDTPWYPTMRLFRQTMSGDWTTVGLRVADALHKLVA